MNGVDRKWHTELPTTGFTGIRAKKRPSPVSRGVGHFNMHQDYIIISTETWKIELPSDWVRKDKSERKQVYFESGDETKGLYLATWRFKPEDHGNSNLRAIEDVTAVELRGFKSMANNNWKTLSEKTVEIGTYAVGELDCYDEENGYRIVCKSIAKLPDVVRSSFHDYACENLTLSRELSDDILKSLQFRE